MSSQGASTVVNGVDGSIKSDTCPEYLSMLRIYGENFHTMDHELVSVSHSSTTSTSVITFLKNIYYVSSYDSYVMTASDKTAEDGNYK